MLRSCGCPAFAGRADADTAAIVTPRGAACPFSDSSTSGSGPSRSAQGLTRTAILLGWPRDVRHARPPQSERYSENHYRCHSVKFDFAISGAEEPLGPPQYSMKEFQSIWPVLLLPWRTGEQPCWDSHSPPQAESSEHRPTSVCFFAPEGPDMNSRPACAGRLFAWFPFREPQARCLGRADRPMSRPRPPPERGTQGS